MNIAIVGLGIIGGSIAKAFAKNTDHHIIGINRTRSTLERALADGAIHEIGTEQSLKNADIVYMCTYPDHIVGYIEKNAELFRSDAVITDVCGIKTEICSKLSKICMRHGLTFCGSHPMAGKEKFSYDAADAELFTGASYIIVPCMEDEEKNSRAVRILSERAYELGFASTRIASPSEHDRMIAFTSQLPHVLACAYVKSPCCPKHTGFSAGSYRDVSRVASINENLWTDLFLDNSDQLCKELDILIDNLSMFRALISDKDAERLKEQLKGSRLVKEALGE